MSLLFGGVIFLFYSTVQGLALVPLIAMSAAGGMPQSKLHELVLNGFNLAFATTVGCPFMLLACGLLARARQGASTADYLALRTLRVGTLVGWAAAMTLTAVGFSLLNDLAGREAPEFIVKTYATAGYLPFFWAAIAVCAPVSEEVLFRGFMFSGLAASRLGAKGAVALTSLAFAIVHGGQYGWVEMVEIAVVGVLLGIARARTGSLFPPLAMHIALNLTSLTLYSLTLETG